MLFTLSGHMGCPWITQQFMVLFGYGLIWTWFYLGFDQKCPAKNKSHLDTPKPAKPAHLTSLGMHYILILLT